MFDRPPLLEEPFAPALGEKGKERTGGKGLSVIWGYFLNK
jgi:hypothetical protein